MTAAPAPDYLDLLHRQGRAWIAKLGHLEHWSETRAADELAILQATPGPDLGGHVEDLRRRMWRAMETHNALPRHERHHHSDPPPDERPPRRQPRGLAKLLKPKD